jgi:hypothetical protein
MAVAHADVRPGAGFSEGQSAASVHQLKLDEIGLNRHRALALCLSMISAQTRSAFVARENRFTLFRIML